MKSKCVQCLVPDWAKNQIADDVDEHEPRRETYGRHRRNRAEETQEVRPSKDVTLFDFMSSTSKQKKDSKPKDAEQHVCFQSIKSSDIFPIIFVLFLETQVSF